jgi:hypothetical protein
MGGRECAAHFLLVATTTGERLQPPTELPSSDSNSSHAISAAYSFNM